MPKRERRERTEELLETFSLTEKRDERTRTLSGGMKRRLMVAKAMVHNPPVLILDEPTAGVDVELRRQLWNYVLELNAKGVTIVLTTHYLEEAQELCDQIAIINRGQVVACEPTTTLLRRMDTRMVLVTPLRQLSRSCRTSPAVWYRSAGLTARHLDTMSLSSCGMAGSISRTDFAPCCVRASSVPSSESDWKGN